MTQGREVTGFVLETMEETIRYLCPSTSEIVHPFDRQAKCRRCPAYNADEDSCVVLGNVGEREVARLEQNRKMGRRTP